MLYSNMAHLVMRLQAFELMFEDKRCISREFSVTPKPEVRWYV